MICNYSFDYNAAGNITEEKGLNENLTITNGEISMTYGKGNRKEIPRLRGLFERSV